ncbi:hypothetical protein Taro_029492 [Colocasia esculenta]|uniref:Stress-response A/B barrel domain-containing protein n=1 Tax=Colocasia esculenta TaxID=4460 RepID=A0A843VXB1_COLES|nr:hypothetical protein [Colocasia esculenta]
MSRQILIGATDSCVGVGPLPTVLSPSLSEEISVGSKIGKKATRVFFVVPRSKRPRDAMVMSQNNGLFGEPFRRQLVAVEMLLCPKTSANIRLPISPLKGFLFSFPRQFPVISPPFVSLPRSSSTPPRPLLAFSTAAHSAGPPPPPAAANTMATVVEHVVLFKPKEDTDPAKLAAMVSNLRSLAALDGVLHLTSGPVLRHRSSAGATLGFTHLLHSRYATKDDLAAYSAHPVHVSVVREHVLPNSDDIMAVDWVGELGSGPVAPGPGSAARVTLVKLKEEAGEEGKREVMAALGEVGTSFPGTIEQFSCGENFSPARAKGFSVASVAVFPSQEELDGLEAKGGDLMAAKKEKVKHLVESVIVLDFLVPPPPAATSGL